MGKKDDKRVRKGIRICADQGILDATLQEGFMQGVEAATEAIIGNDGYANGFLDGVSATMTAINDESCNKLVATLVAICRAGHDTTKLTDVLEE